LEIQRILRSLDSYGKYQTHIQDDVRLQRAFYSLILENFQSIHDYMRLNGHIKEVIQAQVEKSDRKRAKLLKAGYEEIYDKKVELYTERRGNRIKTRYSRSTFTCFSFAKENVSAA